jgi:hypothetical protein
VHPTYVAYVADHGRRMVSMGGVFRVEYRECSVDGLQYYVRSTLITGGVREIYNVYATVPLSSRKLAPRCSSTLSSLIKERKECFPHSDPSLRGGGARPSHVQRDLRSR